jgi:hypothetical protein
MEVSVTERWIGTPPNEMQMQWRLESAQWNVYMKMQNKPESDAVMKMQNQLSLML